MYKKILMALENGPADQTMIPHLAKLAKTLGAELLLLHVADGWAARNFNHLKLAESAEMKADQDYLETVATRLRGEGIFVATQLALGNPPTEILKTAVAEKCDLIAMTSHGHKLIGDIFHGSTIEQVRHNTTIPLLVLRAASASASPNASVS